MVKALRAKASRALFKALRFLFKVLRSLFEPLGLKVEGLKGGI